MCVCVCVCVYIISLATPLSMDIQVAFKYCCSEYRDACIFSNYCFLWTHAQEQDCWIIPALSLSSFRPKGQQPIRTGQRSKFNKDSNGSCQRGNSTSDSSENEGAFIFRLPAQLITAVSDSFVELQHRA